MKFILTKNEEINFLISPHSCDYVDVCLRGENDLKWCHAVNFEVEWRRPAESKMNWFVQNLPKKEWELKMPNFSVENSVLHHLRLHPWWEDKRNHDLFSNRRSKTKVKEVNKYMKILYGNKVILAIKVEEHKSCHRPRNFFSHLTKWSSFEETRGKSVLFFSY